MIIKELPNFFLSFWGLDRKYMVSSKSTCLWNWFATPTIYAFDGTKV
jgi:hypothetical protein